MNRTQRADNIPLMKSLSHPQDPLEVEDRSEKMIFFSNMVETVHTGKNVSLSPKLYSD